VSLLLFGRHRDIFVSVSAGFFALATVYYFAYARYRQTMSADEYKTVFLGKGTSGSLSLLSWLSHSPSYVL
jgi:hypothetical protein